MSSLIEDESNLIAILSNVSALLNDSIDQINWVGFYLIENEALILDHSKVILHVHIAIGKGVCGTAVSEEQTQLVDDVNAFPGHIACDANSKSEIVVPLRKITKLLVY